MRNEDWVKELHKVMEILTTASENKGARAHAGKFVERKAWTHAPVRERLRGPVFIAPQPVRMVRYPHM